MEDVTRPFGLASVDRCEGLCRDRFLLTEREKVIFDHESQECCGSTWSEGLLERCILKVEGGHTRLSVVASMSSGIIKFEQALKLGHSNESVQLGEVHDQPEFEPFAFGTRNTRLLEARLPSVQYVNRSIF